MIRSGGGAVLRPPACLHRAEAAYEITHQAILPAVRARGGLAVQEGAWSETPIRDTSCCDHPLTGVPYLRPGPRRSLPVRGRRASLAELPRPEGGMPGPLRGGRGRLACACQRVWGARRRAAIHGGNHGRARRPCQREPSACRLPPAAAHIPFCYITQTASKLGEDLATNSDILISDPVRQLLSQPVADGLDFEGQSFKISGLVLEAWCATTLAVSPHRLRPTANVLAAFRRQDHHAQRRWAAAAAAARAHSVYAKRVRGDRASCQVRRPPSLLC